MKLSHAALQPAGQRLLHAEWQQLSGLSQGQTVQESCSLVKDKCLITRQSINTTQTATSDKAALVLVLVVISPCTM